MSDALDKAKELISEKNYDESIKLARKRHSRDDVDSYLKILDLLIDDEYLPALEEKGSYYQYYDENHDNGDYGERYFDEYLKKQPKSINVICDKSMSNFNKGNVSKALELMDVAYEKYDEYSEIEKPRISKKDVLMNKIELLVQAKEYKKALDDLNRYEDKYGIDKKLDFYKGQMLQKNGENEEALDYLERSFNDDYSLVSLNAKGDAYFELKEYKKALQDYKQCIKYEKGAGDNLELITNFNYKAAYCCLEMGDEEGAVKHLNKTINMLNEHGRLPKDLEEIYQKCSFEKERIIKKGTVEDKEFKKNKLLPTNYAVMALVIIIILYIILKMNGY